MKKRFNSTGVCVSRKHYMVDITKKLNEIKELIDNEFYFTINRPRQYGKTTTLSQLKRLLKEEYLIISISFEGIGDIVFQDEKRFSNKFLKLISKSIRLYSKENQGELEFLSTEVQDLEELSGVITRFIENSNKEVVLFIDEVDKSSNNQLFLSFIGMLRNKYLARELEEDYTFKSVILAGVHDVKQASKIYDFEMIAYSCEELSRSFLEKYLKLRPEEETKYNSPWNIAVNFNVDMSFSPEEISTMIVEYCEDNDVTMDIEGISNEIYFFTSGYPFLVSRVCQIIDEKIYKLEKKPWVKNDVLKAVKMILEEKNTLFDSMIKNLENNKELYEYIEDIIIKGIDKNFNNDNPIIELGMIYGYFKKQNGKVAIANKIFAERMYNYMVSKLENIYNKMDAYNFKGAFVKPNGGLNIEKVLKKFQQFMKEQYSSKDKEFIEHHGRLLF